MNQVTYNNAKESYDAKYDKAKKVINVVSFVIGAGFVLTAIAMAIDIAFKIF